MGKKYINIFFSKLKYNANKTLIKQSGSLKDKKLEKIRSGQAYLYQKNGMESEVIEINFKNKIYGFFYTALCCNQ